MRLIRSFVLATLALVLPVVLSADAPHAFRVEVTGSGRPMILIPGLASSGPGTWATTVARYQSRYRCHVLTLAGFAGVTPITEPMLAGARTEIASYIRDQHLDHPVIVGHSLGGTLALAIAADHPDLVGPIVVVDSLPFLAGAQFQAKTLEDARPGIAAMRTYMTSQSRDQFNAYVKSGASTKFMATSQTDLDRITQWSLDTDQLTMADAMADLMSLDLREDVARITSPTLVLGTWAGLHEQLKGYGMDLPREAFAQTFEQQFAKLSRLHFAMAERARHFIMFDDPEWFFAQVDAFLAKPDDVVRARGFGR